MPRRGEGAAGIWFSKVLCAWSHLDISKQLSGQALEGDWRWLRPVVGFSMDQEVFRGPASALHLLFPPETNAASSASRRSCHLLVTSERDRSSLGEDELGQGWGKPPPGERYEGACVGVGIYLGGESARQAG